MGCSEFRSAAVPQGFGRFVRGRVTSCPCRGGRFAGRPRPRVGRGSVCGLFERGGVLAEDASTGDAPPDPVGGDGVDVTEPVFSSYRLGGRWPEQGQPWFPPVERLFGQVTGSLFDEPSTLEQCLLHVRVVAGVDRGEEPDDPVGHLLASYGCGVDPAVDAFVEDGGDVVGVVECPRSNHPGEGGVDVEAPRLGVAEGGDQCTVGG